MLTKGTAMALLEIQTAHKDSRALKVMSTENPIKSLMIFGLQDIQKEFLTISNIRTLDFTEQIAYCMIKFSEEVHQYLEGQTNRLILTPCIMISDIYDKFYGEYDCSCDAIVLSKKVICSAINELREFKELVSKVASGDLNTTTLFYLYTFSFCNYQAILQLCGLVNFSNEVMRSKIWSRLHNVKCEIQRYDAGKFPADMLVKEFTNHEKYLTRQLEILDMYKLYDEDFLTFVILFDTKRYNPNRLKGNSKSLQICD